MKLKSGIIGAAVFGLLAQTAFAQQDSNQSNQNANQNLPRGNILATKMPQTSLRSKVLRDTSLSYYHQFLGPTLAGPIDQTYNVFQAATGPEQKSGKAPLQSFQIVNLRHQINPNWGIGVSLAATNGYTGRVKNENGDVNRPNEEFLNARVNLNLPPVSTSVGTLFSTFSYEIPSSVISRRDNMRFGWVIAESFAFKTPNPKWTMGVSGQVYRMVYENNETPVIFNSGPLQGQRCIACTPNQLQTLIVNVGPYANYRYTDKWLFGGLMTFDWDQGGAKTNTMNFNNNLPHRARLSATYFPQTIKYLSSVGLFTQALLKFRPETTAVGAEFSLRF